MAPAMTLSRGMGETTLKNENFVTIQGWMRNELGLKGNDLLVYAIIYGFTQTEGQRFTGSLSYLAGWCGATKAGIIKNLKNLLERGLIERSDRYVNGVKYVEYYATQYNTPVNFVDQGEVNLVECPGKLSKPNNIEDNKDPDIKEDKKEQKHRYGEYQHVLLTDSERDKLMDQYGEAETLAAIKYLDEYISEKGYKSKSHYLAIRRWVFDAVKKNKKGGNRYGWIESAL